MAAFEVDTPEDFEREVLGAKEPTVVVFWAGWCPFCQAFRSLFDVQAARLPGRFAIVRIDEDDNPLWDRYDVRVVPSLALFRDGDLVKRKDGRLMRGLSAAELDAFLREVLPAPPAA